MAIRVRPMPQQSSSSSSKAKQKNATPGAGRAWKIQPVFTTGSTSTTAEQKSASMMMMMVEEVTSSFIPSIPFVGGGPNHPSKRSKGGIGMGGAGTFVFDQVFDETSTTSQIYRGVVRPVVRAVVEGRHATVCAYGATKSGKTYTMQGGAGSTNKQEEDGYGHGVIQRAAADLFEHVDKDVGRKYKVTAQYFEVYNEQLRDLLAGSQGHCRRGPTPSTSNDVPEEKVIAPQPSHDDGDDDDEDDDVSDDDTVSLVPPVPSTRGKNLSPRKLLHSFAVASSSTAKSSNVNRPAAPSLSEGQAKHQRNAPSAVPQLQLREVNGVLTIPAVEEEICSVDDVIHLLNHGARNRAVAKVHAGPMMEQSHHLSSRSHAIFRITVESYGCSSASATSSTAVRDATRWVSVLNLVDLAGSENTDRSGTSGLRLREGGTINQRYGIVFTVTGF